MILGTRPEIIKCAPVIHELRKAPWCELSVCVTGQHDDLAAPMLDFFEVHPDFVLESDSTDHRSLIRFSADMLHQIEAVIVTCKPDVVLVQGDTMSTSIGSLAGFLAGAKVAHIEAGLRSYQMKHPFPEEGNRRMTSVLADFHFAPTLRAETNLRSELIPGEIYTVGNTAVDALIWAIKKMGLTLSDHSSSGTKRCLVTLHRRESFGEPLEDMCKAMKRLLDEHPELEIVWPIHPNPKVRKTVQELLSNHSRIRLLPPLPYPDFIRELVGCNFVMTDSGGIQEEAPSLNKPVLVLRDHTERQEGLDANTARLIGRDPERIVAEATRLLENPEAYAEMAQAKNPYGDGLAAKRIAEVLEAYHLTVSRKAS